MSKDTATTSGDGIAVGVPMFRREQALSLLLESVPEYVETVYIADNGRDSDRSIYGEEWRFDLDVLDLEFDVGIGACRAAIVDACTEPYLWMGDNDMEFVRPNDLRLMQQTLERYDDLGAIAGWLIEGDTVRAGARNLVEHGSTAIKSVDETPELERSVLPFARFDFIPQAALFRTAVFDTYEYDPDVGSTEHFDFFYAHKQAGEWDFASTPAVMVRHNRDIDRDYRESRRGSDHADMAVTAEKWGIDEVVPGSYADWGKVRDRPPAEEAFEVFRRATPTSVWLPTRRVLKRVVER